MYKPEIITTADGSQTLYIREIQEQYHSVNGAITESDYVFLRQGYDSHPAENPVVLEIGFGTGLNCLLTAIRAGQQKRKTVFYSVEKFPLPENITGKLNYGALISEEATELFQKIHTCRWGKIEQITPCFDICKLQLDIITDELDVTQNCHIVYFDAFGPDKQPEMWTNEVFGKIFEKTLTNGILVTYSAKGAVRRQLSAIGFKTERLPGPPGKKEMLRGIKVQSNL